MLRKFILENMDSAEMLFLSRLEHQNTRKLENYAALLLLYDANLESDRFTEKIFGQVFNYISVSERADCDKIMKYLRIILEKKCFDEEMSNIVDEINQIESPNFAIWALYGYYQVKEEVLERIPQISLGFFVKCNYSIANMLMSRYLLNHGYYDCSQGILNVYLMKIQANRFPGRGEIEDYLRIIDQYKEDNINIKDQEMKTYNYLVSLYLNYLVIEASEYKETEGILFQGTIKFMLRLMKSLMTLGIGFDMGNGSFISLAIENNILVRTQEADKLIVDKFVNLSPDIDIGGEICLSGDYYYMLLYMHSFSEVISRLFLKASPLIRTGVISYYIFYTALQFYK